MWGRRCIHIVVNASEWGRRHVDLAGGHQPRIQRSSPWQGRQPGSVIHPGPFLSLHFSIPSPWHHFKTAPGSLFHAWTPSVVPGSTKFAEPFIQETREQFTLKAEKAWEMWTPRRRYNMQCLLNQAVSMKRGRPTRVSTEEMAWNGQMAPLQAPHQPVFWG